MDEFEGEIFHAADWPDDVDVAGKRVAVVGGGATSIQVVPYAAAHAEHVVAFVPTPSYVIPKPEERYAEVDRVRFRAEPELLVQARDRCLANFEALGSGRFPFDPDVNARHVATWRETFDSIVVDPELRRVLTPAYAYGCRRLLVSNDYYPAMTQSNVTVVGSRLASLRPHAVVAADGREFPADIVVLATGYEANRWLNDVRVEGAKGVLLSDRWAAGPEAYLGTAVDGFPNLFVIDGPNAQVTSITDILVAHARYAVTCIESVAAAGGSRIEVDASAVRSFNDELDARLSASVLALCDSYYRIGGSGRIISHWPGSASELEQRLKEPVLEDYVVA